MKKPANGGQDLRCSINGFDRRYGSCRRLAAVGAFLTGLALQSGSSLAAETEIIGAEPVVRPNIERRELQETKIDATDFELGAFVGVLSVEDFGANMVTGVRAAYHVTEDFFVEAAFATSDTDPTSYERLSGSAALLTPAQRKYRYYDLSLGYNLLPGESFLGGRRAFNSDMYLIGGIGATKFAGDNRLRHEAQRGRTQFRTLHLGRSQLFKRVYTA